MNRNKKDKIILIIVLSAFGLILFSCVVVVPIIVGLIKEDNINKKIYNSLCNFDHSSNVVYYDDNYIYYNGDIAKFDNMDVLWIDETNIFYYDSTKKIYILDMGSNRVLLSKNFKGYSKTIFVRNNIIYSKYRSNTFYKYDILSCDSTQISDEEYYFMRDESKYSVSISTLDVKIINNETNDNINISKDNMSREDSFSSIYNFNCFVIDDYRLHNDDIFLKLHYLYYEIIIRYDIINNHFELCDWLNCHYYSTDICFYVFENKYPASLERYFMVNAYE